MARSTLSGLLDAARPLQPREHLFRVQHNRSRWDSNFYPPPLHDVLHSRWSLIPEGSGSNVQLQRLTSFQERQKRLPGRLQEPEYGHHFTPGQGCISAPIVISVSLLSFPRVGTREPSHDSPPQNPIHPVDTLTHIPFSFQRSSYW
jgi:hypothetical protein